MVDYPAVSIFLTGSSLTFISKKSGTGFLPCRRGRCALHLIFHEPLNRTFIQTVFQFENINASI